METATEEALVFPGTEEAPERTTLREVVVPARTMYIGPGDTTAGLRKHMVFVGGVGAHLEPLFAECPALGRLCFSLGEAAAAEKRASVAGEPEAVWTDEARRYLQSRSAGSGSR
jgi:hypothetical protein